MKFLRYSLELENVKEYEIPEKDKNKLIQFNNKLAEDFGLEQVAVLENDNLYFMGILKSRTKTENNAKLKLLIEKLNNIYKDYNLKRIIKSCIINGNII